MRIVTYPHPALRHVSKPLKRVDAEIRKIVAEMLEVMYAGKGVGLAANQVDLPLRMFVANLESDPDEGEQHIFINPVVSRPKGLEEKEEGCLSLPEFYGPVKRPEQVHFTAYNLQGELIEGDLTGMIARIVQHETDHLDGVLFVDRLSETGKMDARDALTEFETKFTSRREAGEIPGDEEIARRLAELESRFC